MFFVAMMRFEKRWGQENRMVRGTRFIEGRAASLEKVILKRNIGIESCSGRERIRIELKRLPIPSPSNHAMVRFTEVH